MSVLEVMMTILFVVPLAAACLVFMLCALWMQIKEEQRMEEEAKAAPVRRRARRAAYHAA